MPDNNTAEQKEHITEYDPLGENAAKRAKRQELYKKYLERLIEKTTDPVEKGMLQMMLAEGIVSGLGDEALEYERILKDTSPQGLRDRDAKERELLKRREDDLKSKQEYDQRMRKEAAERGEKEQYDLEEEPARAGETAQEAEKREWRNQWKRLRKFLQFLGKEAKAVGRKASPGKEIRQQKPGEWEEENWSEYGWDKNATKNVVDLIKPAREITLRYKNQEGEEIGITFTKHELRNAQIHTILEMLIASGKKPEEVRREFERRIQDYENPDANSPEKTAIIRLDYRQGDVESWVANAEPEDLRRLKFFGNLGLNDEYLRKFVFYEEFENNNYDEYIRRQDPKDIEDLAWNVMYSDKEKWGLEGRFPVLQMRIYKEKDPQTGKETERWTGDYYVNVSNLNRWNRERMMYWISEDPLLPHNYFTNVYLLKSFMSKFTIQDMFSKEDTIFRSRHKDDQGKGISYLDVAYHWRKEAGGTTFLRQLGLQYRAAMGDLEGLINKLQEIYYNSDMTRKIFDANMLSHLVNLPLNYDAVRSDKKLGTAWLEMWLVYYHLSDIVKLKEILGEKSSFFTRSGLYEAARQRLAARKRFDPMREFETVFSPEGEETFAKAFNKKTGEIEDEKEFIKFINFYKTPIQNTQEEDTVRQALKNAIAEKYDLYSEFNERDDASIDLIEELAFDFNYIAGGYARNDTEARSTDALNSMMLMRETRLSNMHLGGAYGFPGTIDQFIRLIVPYAEAIQTESRHAVYDKDGNRVYDKHGDPVYRHKSQLEVLEDLQRLRNRQLQKLRDFQQDARKRFDEAKDPKAKAAIQEDVQKEIDFYDAEFRKRLSQLDFSAASMYNYAKLHLKPAIEIYNNIKYSKEFDFDKFSEFTYWGGIKFKRAEFQEAIMEHFLKPLYSMYKKFNQINFSQMVRSYQPNGQYEEVPLAEAMFGYKLLNRRAFWKLDKNGKPMKDEREGHKYRNAINYDFINTEEGKELLQKSFFLMEIANRLASHLQTHSTDPYFNFTYYLDVIKILESMPATIRTKKGDVLEVLTETYFFSKDDIEWFKRIGGMSDLRLYWRGILESYFKQRKPEESAVEQVLTSIVQAGSPR